MAQIRGLFTFNGVLHAVKDTANPLSQFAATTSAQLAGVISDETGGFSKVAEGLVCQ